MNVKDIKPILCFHCWHCFRDDNFGVCCICEESEHYTRNWDLDYKNITECEDFKYITNGINYD